ncbi:histidine phosphatase family protein [Enterococcus raffinosus]|uniref:histidine phosphatase family protein n=1 Tax=Enterococcus raffinosus TaxID=71452 RepID=UPI0009DBFF05
MNTPFTEKEIEVAEQLGKGLKKEKVNFVSIYSSDSRRARETADVVLEASGQNDLDFNKYERLRESCFGIYEGDADDNIWGPVTKSLGCQSLEAWRASDKFSVEEGLDELAKIDSSKQAESFGKVRKRAGSTKRYHRRNRSRWSRECADCYLWWNYSCFN